MIHHVIDENSPKQRILLQLNHKMKNLIVIFVLINKTRRFEESAIVRQTSSTLLCTFIRRSVC